MKKAISLLSFLVLVTSLTFAQNRQQLDKFSVVAPVTLNTGGPEKGTTKEGKEYTSTSYVGELSNGDAYMTFSADYPFTLGQADEERAMNGFLTALPNGEIIQQRQDIVIGGRHAIAVVFRATDKDGTKMDFFWVFAYNGSTAYQFVFATSESTHDTDIAAVKTFFGSIAYN